MVILYVSFFLVALALIGGINWYLWRRLVRDTTRPGRVRLIGTLVMASLPVLVIGALAGARALPPAAARVLAWPGYLWLALMCYLLLVMVLLELPLLVVRRWLLRRWPRETEAGGAPERGPDRGRASRRLLLARGAAIAAGAVAAGTVGWGVASALGPPVLRRVQVPLAKLPRRLDGLRIAVISDIHVSEIIGRRYVRRLVDAVNGLDPDLVAVVGDLADGSASELGMATEPLRELRSRLGAYFVTGNHDYYSGVEPWIEKVSELGLRVLRNERVSLDGFDLAGVNDIGGGEFGDPPDYQRALGGRDRTRPVVLLAHQPAQAFDAVRFGVDLQISGHTHGGQMWPVRYLVRAIEPVVEGLGRVEGMPVYVSEGAGFWGPPVRVGTSPEVGLVVLRAP